MAGTDARRDGRRSMWQRVVIGIVAVLAAYLAVQGIRCSAAVRESRGRLASYGARTARLSYGDMAYVDQGEGVPVLSVHGIFGGYDQACDTARTLGSGYRIIAPSRFGYPGSDVKGDGTPSEQADAFCELLDQLGIDKVWVLATSAGGASAIRFALDHPERTYGLILYSSAMPPAERPESWPDYAGPPEALCNDYAMFLVSPLFEPIMGMDPSTIDTMLPVDERREGVVLDASVTNPDMQRNFDDYPVEELQVPVLVVQAKDDKLVDFAATEAAVGRFPDCTFVVFEDGGHLMAGHEDEASEAVHAFVSSQPDGSAT